MMDPVLAQLSDTVPTAKTLEQLTRPLLEMLGHLTSMESTYLTTIDLSVDIQHVLYSRNEGSMQIPEGLDVPWGDTLCKRALDEDRMFTSGVADCWGDSEAARALGIQTYLSTPVKDASGALLGTLCAASAQTRALRADAQPVLRLFANLVATFMEREALMQRLQNANRQLTSFALTDPLTGLPNRRAIMDELTQLLAQARRDRTFLFVCMIDLDGFKQINDSLGHQAGDTFLRDMGARMRQALRTGDRLGRLGGDEFMVVATHAQSQDLLAHAHNALQARISRATQGVFDLGAEKLDYAGASVGVAIVDAANIPLEAAIEAADREMYRIKAERKAAAQQAAGDAPHMPVADAQA